MGVCLKLYCCYLLCTSLCIWGLGMLCLNWEVRAFHVFVWYVDLFWMWCVSFFEYENGEVTTCFDCCLWCVRVCETVLNFVTMSKYIRVCVVVVCFARDCVFGGLVCCVWVERFVLYTCLFGMLICFECGVYPFECESKKVATCFCYCLWDVYVFVKLSCILLLYLGMYVFVLLCF
jgi:hypothetical protein